LAFQIETYGSMEKKEKVELILEQVSQSGIGDFAESDPQSGRGNL
jgi:hypothetical protein